MNTEIRVPLLPESVKEAVIATWHKQLGDWIERDEILADIETDKIVLEIVAPHAGRLENVLKNKGDKVIGEELIAYLQQVTENTSSINKQTIQPTIASPIEKIASPSVRRLIHEHNIVADKISVSNENGRIQKEEVWQAIHQEKRSLPAAIEITSMISGPEKGRTEKRVPLSMIRSRIAERLLTAQNNAAILTTFNEINMDALTKIKTQYQEIFEKKHTVKLGWMSFFTIAVCHALQRFPIINAFLEENNIVYHDYCDIGVAVASKRGLVVPVIRQAENLNLASIEKQIFQFGQKAKKGNLNLEDLQGGTFTISNGGVFGSLLSTPILNSPQSAILGMHKIEERPVVIKGEIKVCRMMYVALSYDHRLIDGADAVQFLVAVKEYIECPERLLLAL